MTRKTLNNNSLQYKNNGLIFTMYKRINMQPISKTIVLQHGKR